MNCDREMLIAFVLGDFDEDRNREVEAHLGVCEACSERVAELRETVDVMAAMPETPSRPVSLERLHEQIAAHKTRPAGAVSAWVSWLVPQWRWGFAAAFAACLVLCAFHYGVAVEVGGKRVAIGRASQSTPALDEKAIRELARREIARAGIDQAYVRGLAREEIANVAGPAFHELAGRLDKLDTHYRQALVSLRSYFTYQLAAGRNEIDHNIHLLANTVDEVFTGRP